MLCIELSHAHVCAASGRVAGSGSCSRAVTQLERPQPTAQPQPVIYDPLIVRGAYTFVKRSMGLIHTLLTQGLSARAHRSEVHTAGASRVPGLSHSVSLSLLNMLQHRRDSCTG
jgi:hypothetical protein